MTPTPSPITHFSPINCTTSLGLNTRSQQAHQISQILRSECNLLEIKRPFLAQYCCTKLDLWKCRIQAEKTYQMSPSNSDILIKPPNLVFNHFNLKFCCTLQKKYRKFENKYSQKSPSVPFSHSCVCERFIYFQDQSTCFPVADKADCTLGIYKSLTDT